MTSASHALSLIDKLVAARRISTLEAEALRAGVGLVETEVIPVNVFETADGKVLKTVRRLPSGEVTTDFVIRPEDLAELARANR